MVHNKSHIFRTFLLDAPVVLTTLSSRLGKTHKKCTLFWNCLAVLTFFKRIADKNLVGYF